MPTSELVTMLNEEASRQVGVDGELAALLLSARNALAAVEGK